MYFRSFTRFTIRKVDKYTSGNTRWKSLTCNTIFALSSGLGKSGVAVIRVSGPKSSHCLEQMCGGMTKPRVASVRKLMDPHTKEILDKGLILWFPEPHSFTGEDCVEFHVHGGHAVITSVLKTLGSIAGLRPAQAGDFTRQAFINGKLDLTEVEGLGDLIHAETEAQRKQALRQMEGELGHIYSDWRTRLIKCLANMEAFIDFHEEENIEGDILNLVSSEVLKLQKEILGHLNDNRRGERLRDGVHVVILGEPNVGKSSLLNALCQRPAAIVSPIAGTTRDIVETALNIAGYPVLISDTAGLRESSDAVEKEGVARALERANNADIKILVLDFNVHLKLLQSSPLSEFVEKYMHNLGLTSYISDVFKGISVSLDRSVLSDKTDLQKSAKEMHEKHLQSLQKQDQKPLKSCDFSNFLIVINKCDLMEEAYSPDCIHSNWICAISCKSGQGLNTLLELLVNRLKNICGDPNQGSPSLTHTRYRHHLSRCLKHMDDFYVLLPFDVVLAAEQLRMASRELGQITGAVSAEDILDIIFRDFCIGK